MKTQSILGLCLSASLLLAGPAAMADNGQDKPKNARAVQVQLDKKTGKKLSAPDDSDLAAATAEAETFVDTKGMMSVDAEPAQYHSDGSMSVKLGTKNLKYLVMTVDDNGDKSLSHQKEDGLSLRAVDQDKGEK